MEQELNPHPEPQLTLGNFSRHYLLAAGKWARLLGIIYALVMLLLVLIIVVGFSVLSSFFGAKTGMPPGLMLGVGIVYIVFLGAIVFYPILALISFGGKIKSAIATDSQEDFNAGLRHLSGLFKFLGIALLIIVSIYAMVFLIYFATRA
jgi:hypothetical protein